MPVQQIGFGGYKVIQQQVSQLASSPMSIAAIVGLLLSSHAILPIIAVVGVAAVTKAIIDEVNEQRQQQK